MTDRSGSRVFITGSGSISGSASSVAELWSYACNHERIPGSAPTDREIATLIGLSSGDLSILGRH